MHRPLSRLCLILLTTSLACTTTEVKNLEPILAITHVDVLPMTDEVMLHDQNVIVQGGRIVGMGPAATTSVPTSARRIDGTGKYLIPGLADMHVHVDHPSELGIYPAYGVTSVLNLRGLPKHLEWRDDVAAGDSLRPTLWTTGDYVDGYPPTMQPMMSFANPEDAAAAVVEQQAAGYDFIKVYTRLSVEQFDAVGRAAQAAGIAVVGHGSGNYSLKELMTWQVNISHGEEVIRWYWDPERPQESLDEIVETLKSGTTTVTANLNFSRSLIRQKLDLESWLDLPEARYLHPAIFQPFRRENNRYARRDDAWLGRVRRGFAVQKQLIKRLADEGGVVLAGTDASTAGVYPGYSITEELQEMVSAGLTPMQALRTATRNPGDFIARTRPTSDPKFGRVAEGFRADLVLLDRNPLEDIANVSAIAGIVLRGRWASSQELQSELSRLDESFEELRTPVKRLEQLIVAGRIEEARALFDATRETRPGAVLFSQYVPFFVGYGFLYGEDGFHPDPRRLEVALGLYQMYAETYPEFHSAHYMLAQAYQANGHREEAVAAVEEALRLHPYYPDAKKLLQELTVETLLDQG